VDKNNAEPTQVANFCGVILLSDANEIFKFCLDFDLTLLCSVGSGRVAMSADRTRSPSSSCALQHLSYLLSAITCQLSS
jgi:hypothetical protein